MFGYDIDQLELVQDLVLRVLRLGLVPMLLLSLIIGTVLAMRAQRRVAAGDRERVLQRFHRTERSRTVGESGLRLSLVDAIARLHGFELRIGDAKPDCIVDILCNKVAAIRS